jgi:hypothetical protein
MMIRRFLRSTGKEIRRFISFPKEGLHWAVKRASASYTWDRKGITRIRFYVTLSVWITLVAGIMHALFCLSVYITCRSDIEHRARLIACAEKLFRYHPRYGHTLCSTTVMDCSCFIARIYSDVDGVRLTDSGTGRGVEMIYKWCREQGIHRSGIARMGDLVFFDMTKDVDGDGRITENDRDTHIGLVEAVLPDGSFIAIHATDSCADCSTGLGRIMGAIRRTRYVCSTIFQDGYRVAGFVSLPEVTR